MEDRTEVKKEGGREELVKGWKKIWEEELLNSIPLCHRGSNALSVLGNVLGSVITICNSLLQSVWFSIEWKLDDLQTPASSQCLPKRLQGTSTSCPTLTNCFCSIVNIIWNQFLLVPFLQAIYASIRCSQKVQTVHIKKHPSPSK